MASSYALLVNAFPRRIRDERPLGPCGLKRIGRPENEGLGNYDIMNEGNDVVIIKRKVPVGRVEERSEFMVKPIFKYTGPWTRRHECMERSRSGVMGFWLN